MTAPDVDTAPDAMWRARRTTAYAMFALVVLVAFESFAVTTVMPQVADLLGGRELYAFAFAGPLATGAVGMVVAGAWADRRGPAAPFATGVALFVTGLVVAGAAQSMPVLVAGRLAQGLGGGVVNVTLLVAVARAYPPVLHPRVFAWFSTAWVLPSIVGPSLAGLVAELAGWRWVFLGVAVLVLPATVPLLATVRRLGRAEADGTAPAAAAPTPAAPSDAGTDDPGDAARRVGWAVLVAVAILALNVAATLPVPWSPVVAVGAAVVAVAAARPLLPVGALRVRHGLPSVISTRGLLSGAFFGAQVYVPYLLVDRDGWGATASGLGLSTAALAWSASSVVQGRLGSRLRSRTAVRTGATLLVVGVAGAALATALDLPAGVVVAVWTASGAGMGLASSRLNVLLLGWSAPQDQGRNSAANSIADSVGAALALALTGVVFVAAGGDGPYGGPGPFVGAFALTAALAVAALLVAPRVGVPRTERQDVEPDPSSGSARASAAAT
ncbi:major facilitator superfamily MFS_1 [Cellulomonas flavigena DSM 20109]|uniref:Major facilitator superfamily MFS_1 n=1 Tax=Cellulomonas flavigena (strain ATCC 482 / DSM 20109 / BCRC 11376 / JCM 18109 / NBRC 3775 / NCIMB 8073 / NRS 134) TaxID=446466 RepID=D5UDQ0_CELFN|nr:MFS transporter [Cellulomonas flavigena]ADG74458.1 major facilitator superfamily MFS_1 [Cellulomonas flavigena DSM 20109]